MSNTYKSKVCMIIPYFGKFPDFFNLFLFSCKRNKIIDFHFFTDCEIPATIYDNTFFHIMSYKEYCDMISEKLLINCHPDNPYKLCDIRPFYGVIHNELIETYLFWGYCDIDLLFGDLSNLLTEKRLQKYDIITTHSTRLAGHFTIIKSKSKFTKYCYKIKNWENKLLSNEFLGIDEGDFYKVVNPYARIIRKLAFFVNRQNENYYISQILQNLFHFLIPKTCFLECYTTPIPNKNDVWKYMLQSGKFINPNNEFYIHETKKDYIGQTYLHFLFFKKNKYRNSSIFWDENYYKIPRYYNFDQSNDIIVITNVSISIDDTGFKS